MSAPEVWRLSRSLEGEPWARPLPAGVTTTRWRPEFARNAHALMTAAYQRGGGSVEPFEEWLEWFTTDEEFDAESCFFAWHGAELAGVALCWSSAFVKDLCVAERFRRQGLGSALLGLCMRHFRARGHGALELRSRADNPSGANRLYHRLGFVRVPD